MTTLKKILILFLQALLIILLLTQCARKGTPTGGPIDQTPPAIVRMDPENLSVNFNGQEITIYFDEFVKFKDLQKQLIVSPPFKNRPEITPQGGVSKKISIKITDTLLENTTYTLNFGQSIVDNTEENPYPYFKYVFSTGTYIDSLKITGKITDALLGKADDFVSVQLYEYNDSFNDSTIFKQTPRYVTNTLDSLTSYTLENLKAGTYKLIAIKERSSNLKYDPETDKIGFVSQPVTIPTDSVFDLKLFKSISDSEITRPYHHKLNEIRVGYKGNLDSLKINTTQKDLVSQSQITKLKDKDTLQYWFKPVIDADSVSLQFDLDSFKEEKTIALNKELAIDSISLKQEGGFNFRDNLRFTSNTPIDKVDITKVSLMNIDSVGMDINYTLNRYNNLIEFDFERIENEKYLLTMLPGAVIDFFGYKNDSLTTSFGLKNQSDYGSILLNLENVKDWPIIIQILDEKKLTVVAEKFSVEETSFDFMYLDPGSFLIRVIEDRNGNKQFDPGNYLKNKQPERVTYYPEPLKLQANWDRQISIKLE